MRIAFYSINISEMLYVSNLEFESVTLSLIFVAVPQGPSDGRCSRYTCNSLFYQLL